MFLRSMNPFFFNYPFLQIIFVFILGSLSTLFAGLTPMTDDAMTCTEPPLECFTKISTYYLFPPSAHIRRPPSDLPRRFEAPARLIHSPCLAAPGGGIRGCRSHTCSAQITAS